MATVTGFHACSNEFAQDLEDGRLTVAEWHVSQNRYDWLGDGIYFWENSFQRAKEWGESRLQGTYSVIEAEIELGTCLDLTNTKYQDLLAEVYESLVVLYQEQGWLLPKNTDVVRHGFRSRLLNWLDAANTRMYWVCCGVEFRREQVRRLRFLDRLVINQFLSLMESGYDEETIYFQTTRCPFEEGDVVFPGSMIRRQTHIQIAVRDRDCIQDLRFHHFKTR